MEWIFFEKQEGQLCAQHALNALLQGSYFTAVDLAQIAEQLDEQERINMAEAGVESQEYRDFLAGGSNNMDDSGFFSVQVIETALKVWQLELIPYNSKNMISDAARADPTTQKAFICNYHEHWFTIRKIGKQWFNLNSIKSGPELISNTYLSLLLTQLQSEGYSIFIVNGILPESKADQMLANTIIEPSMVQPPIPKLKIRLGGGGGGGPSTSTPIIVDDDGDDAVRMVKEATVGIDGFTDEERKQLQATIAQSLSSNEEDERKQLELAMALSLASDSCPQPSTSSSGQGTSSAWTSSSAAGQRSSKQSSSSSSVSPPSSSSSSMTPITNPLSDGGPSSASNHLSSVGDQAKDVNQMTEQEMLDVALKMSLETS